MLKSITFSADVLKKRKKLFMKNVINTLRNFFNSKKLAFHLLAICVSIKPGSKTRCATLQSYPNQGVWKSLKCLAQNLKDEIYELLILELQDKSKKFPSEFLIEFEGRIRNDFDFLRFYRKEKHDEEENFTCIEEENLDTIDSTEENYQQVNVKQKKCSKGIDFVSEPRQILIQMQLCNQQKSLAEITPFHYQKLRTLLEKIKESKYKYKQSEEMREFEQELRIFCEQGDSNLDELPKKRVMKSEIKKQIVHDDSQHVNKEDIQIVKQEDIQQLDILRQFQQRIEIIEPGIKLFLPQYSKRISDDNKKRTLVTEEEYFKHLYYFERAENIELTPKIILSTWIFQYEPYVLKYLQLLKEEEICKK